MKWSILPHLWFLAIIAPLFNPGFASAVPGQLHRRTYPNFPEQPPSCQICKNSYDQINNCAQASVVFENVTQIIWNPSAFIDVIECACVDTFKAVFPQCVDCFVITNQTTILQTNNLPSLVSGMKQICTLFSALLGGVASTNQQLPSQTPITVSPTQSSAARPATRVKGGGMPFIILAGTAFIGVIMGVALMP